MKFAVLGILVLSTSSLANAADCSNGYRCGSEYHDQPYRAPRAFSQPAAPVVKGSCDANLPSDQSYNAVLTGVTCGEAAQRNVRTPLEVPKEVRREWDVLSRSGLADAQKRMQQIRQQEVKWSGKLDIPMYENWTYQVMVGDYNSSRCGSENYTTTCYKDREEQYEHVYYVDVCDRYVEDDDDGPSFGGSGSFGGGSSSGGGSSGGSRSSPYNNSSPSQRGGGSGNDYNNSRSRARDSWGSSLEEEYKPTNPSEKFMNQSRMPASRRCVSWSKERKTERRWRSAQRLSYSCVKQRGQWCTWLETRSGSRACKKHTVKYDLEYTKDPKWAPGYVDPVQPTVRSYLEILPNRFDLLPGEQEEIFVFANTGVSKTVTPKMTFKNSLEDHAEPWNEYSYRVEPQSISCQFNMKPEFKISVITEGRNKQTAPNPLGVPSEPLKFDSAGIKNRPESLQLVDKARAVQLQAAAHSRNFPRPHNSGNLDPHAVYEDNGEPLKGASASGGYWQESRFKLQLFRKDKWGRDVRVTVRPETYSYDQIDVFNDTITISLEGRDGTDRFYRPGGPMEFLLGRLYKAFNAELTPGREYFIRMWVISRGLPFYESGCKGGKAICKGEEGSAESYGEPLEIPFIAKENIDGRSWFRAFKDWQEKWMLW